MGETGEILLRLALFASLGLGAGFLSGLFGIGGGIVRIPLFMLLFPAIGVSDTVVMHLAIGTSVALILPTSIVATRKQLRLGNLDLDYFKTWAVGIFIGVLIGMALLPYVSTITLKIIFAIYIVLVGCYVGFVKDTVVAHQPPSGLLKMIISTVIGVCAALTGTGGGALVTPALKAYGQPLNRAIALSSATGLVIGAVGIVAVAVQGLGVPDRPSRCLGFIDLMIFLAMLPTTLIAAPIGAGVSNSMNKDLLRRVYTLLLFIIAADLIWKLS